MMIPKRLKQQNHLHVQYLEDHQLPDTQFTYITTLHPFLLKNFDLENLGVLPARTRSGVAECSYRPITYLTPLTNSLPTDLVGAATQNRYCKRTVQNLSVCRVSLPRPESLFLQYKRLRAVAQSDRTLISSHFL